MPTAHVYIRQEDLRLWQQLSNKSEWIHEQLTGEEYVDVKDLDRIVKLRVQEELDKREREYV